MQVLYLVVKIPKFYEKVTERWFITHKEEFLAKIKKATGTLPGNYSIFNLQAKKSVQFSDVKLKNGLIAVCKKRLDVNNEN